MGHFSCLGFYGAVVPSVVSFAEKTPPTATTLGPVSGDIKDKQNHCSRPWRSMAGETGEASCSATRRNSSASVSRLRVVGGRVCGVNLWQMVLILITTLK